MTLPERTDTGNGNAVPEIFTASACSVRNWQRTMPTDNEHRKAAQCSIEMLVE